MLNIESAHALQYDEDADIIIRKLLSGVSVSHSWPKMYFLSKKFNLMKNLQKIWIWIFEPKLTQKIHMSCLTIFPKNWLLGPKSDFKLVCFVAFYWTAKKIFKLCSLLEACVWPQLRPLAWLRLTSIKNWRKARKKHSSLTQKREVAFPPWRRCTPSFSFLTF